MNGPGAEAVIGTQIGTNEGREWRFGIPNLLLDGSLWKGEAGIAGDESGPSTASPSASATSRPTHRVGATAQRAIRTSRHIWNCPRARSRKPKIASDLCSVLSIAQGTLISWIYVERVSLPDDVTFACHRPAVTRQHNGSLPLIDPNDENDLTRFVEAVAAKFQLKEAERRLRVLARAIADVRTTDQQTIAQVSSLIEYIVWRDANICRRAFILDAKAFGSRERDIKAAVQDALADVFPDADEAKLQTICHHIPALNRVPFAELLAVTSSEPGGRDSGG